MYWIPPKVVALRLDPRAPNFQLHVLDSRVLKDRSSRLNVYLSQPFNSMYWIRGEGRVRQGFETQGLSTPCIGFPVARAVNPMWLQSGFQLHVLDSARVLCRSRYARGLSTPCIGFTPLDPLLMLLQPLSLSTPCIGFLGVPALLLLLMLPFNSMYWIHLHRFRNPTGASMTFNSMYWIQWLEYSNFSWFTLSTPCIGFRGGLTRTGTRLRPFNSMYWIQLQEEPSRPQANTNFQLHVLDSPACTQKLALQRASTFNSMYWILQLYPRGLEPPLPVLSTPCIGFIPYTPTYRPKAARELSTPCIGFNFVFHQVDME